MNKKYIIPIMIPEKKYPYNCTFFYQKGKLTKKDIRDTIDKYLASETDYDEVEIAFLGKAFTSLDEKKQKELLEIINEYIQNEKVNKIRIFARPDQINNNLLKTYKKYGIKTIELETMSRNDYILKCTKAPYRYKDIKRAAREIRWKGFVLGCHMLVGLPDSTRIDEINTAKELVKLKPKVARISPIFVMKDTKLEKDFNKQEYKPLTEMQGIEICKDLVRIFADKNVDTIRIGLQDADLKEDEGIVSGPYHPAFRKYVEINMWYDAIVEKIKQLSVKVKEVEISVNQADVENVIGIKNENMLKLKEIYDVDLIVKSNDEIKPGKCKIEIVKTFD